MGGFLGSEVHTLIQLVLEFRRIWITEEYAIYDMIIFQAVEDAAERKRVLPFEE